MDQMKKTKKYLKQEHLYFDPNLEEEKLKKKEEKEDNNEAI